MIATERQELRFHYVLIFHFKLFSPVGLKKTICFMFGGNLNVLSCTFAELKDKQGVNVAYFPSSKFLPRHFFPFVTAAAISLNSPHGRVTISCSSC